MSKTSLHGANITTLAELERFCEDVRNALSLEEGEVGEQSFNAVGETTYVKAPTTTLRMALIKERLSDGSHVYDIQVTEHAANAATERAA